MAVFGSMLGGTICDATVRYSVFGSISLPSVGTTTIEKLAAARAGCVVLEAGKTVILEKQKVFELAERHKIAIVGFEAKRL